MLYHENLTTYKKAISFAWTIYLLCKDNNFISKDINIRSQLQRASISISSNIAEWCARWSRKDYIRFLYISRWSISEVISIIRVCNEIWYIKTDEINTILINSQELFKLLNGLIKRLLVTNP